MTSPGGGYVLYLDNVDVGLCEGLAVDFVHELHDTDDALLAVPNWNAQYTVHLEAVIVADLKAAQNNLRFI